MRWLVLSEGSVADKLIRYHFILPSLFLCLIACRDEDPVSNDDTGVNRLENASFETGSQPLLAGWMPNDTSLVRFSTSAPPGGGSYSLELLPGAIVTATVVAPQAEYRYRLSFYGRSNGGSGRVEFATKNPNATVTIRDSIPFADTLWTLSQGTPIPLITMMGDSFQVILNGPATASGSVLLDLVRLDRMEY